MKYGNYIINAEQAAEMANKVNHQMAIATENLSLAQAEAELNFIGGKILATANEGWNMFSWWIRFQSTYDKLVALGYEVSSGVLYESLSAAQRENWGTAEDRFVIKWGQK